MIELTVRVTDVVVGVVEAIGVGYNLQEDVHLVQDGGESGIFPVIGHNLGRCDSQGSKFISKNNRVAVSQLSNHLLSEPGAASLGHPLPGVDSSVDPDGGTVASTSAELRRGSKQGVETNLCANT